MPLSIVPSLPIGRHLALGALTLALLAGCHKKPGGQVIAVVNSEEITQPELRAEADAMGIPPGQDPQSYAPAVLQRVIDRNLLAGYARDHGLDRGPDYLSHRRQLEESLLANLTIRKLTEGSRTPTPAQVQAFIAQNPLMFAKRERLSLDQIRFPTPSDRGQVKALMSLGSLDAIESKLKNDKVQVIRGGTSIDTGAIERSVAARISAIPTGQVFDLSTGGVTYMSAIKARLPIAASPQSWTQLATTVLSRQQVQKSANDELVTLRKAARIEYDPAFKPAAPTAAGAPAR